MRGPVPVVWAAALLLVVPPTALGDEQQCWALSKPLPAGCPETIGPPCPRCYVNPMPDYTPGVSPLNLTAEARAEMAGLLEQYMALVAAGSPSADSDATVFSGAAGRALAFYKHYRLTGNATSLATAETFLKDALGHLGVQKIKDLVAGFTGFLWSRVGTLSLAAVVAAEQGRSAESQSYVNQVQDIVDARSGKYDDFDSGRAGLLYAAQFLNHNLNRSAITPVSMLALAQAIVERGAELMTPAADYLQWHGPNDNGLWLGTSHGAAGILHPLLAVPALLANATARALIQKTINHIVASQQPSGNFPTEYYNATEDVLVQWDHGGPGVSACLNRAYSVFQDKAILVAAQRAMDLTWRRGLVSKGLELCHGISGNTYMFLSHYRSTGNATALYRALAFQELVVRTPLLSDPAHMRQPQPATLTWQLWVGNYLPAIVLWSDLLYASPNATSMTGFEVAL